MTRDTPETSPDRVTADASDRDLWSAVQRGDDRAWEILVRRYEALVYTVTTRAGLSLAEAADCFQQTWVLLHRHRKRIKQPERLSAWLVTTAKREALRMRRRGRRDVDLELAPPAVDTAPLPDEELAALERRARLETVLERLDRRCAELLRALFLDPEERSYEQIAGDLGIPKNSIGPVRSRCLKRAHDLLHEDGWC